MADTVEIRRSTSSKGISASNEGVPDSFANGAAVSLATGVAGLVIAGPVGAAIGAVAGAIGKPVVEAAYAYIQKASQHKAAE